MDSEPPSPSSGETRSRVERLLREAIRRGLEKGLEAGIGTISRTDTAVRDWIGEGKLPRELAGYIFSQIDETKSALVRVVAREVRDFLAATDMGEELKKAMVNTTLEIRTQIRFVPSKDGTVETETEHTVE